MGSQMLKLMLTCGTQSLRLDVDATIVLTKCRWYLPRAGRCLTCRSEVDRVSNVR